MTPRRHLEALDLGAVLAPFATSDGRIDASIEDDHGRCLATTSGAGAEPAEPRERAAADIVVHGDRAGRVVLAGRTADPALLQATADALASGLSLAVSAANQGPDAGAAAALETELAHGRRLQRSFVSLVPPDVPGYDVASYYEAAREVGGDFFDLFRLRRRGRPLSIVIADVTGKGIAAALLMAFSRPLLHAAIDHTTNPVDALERTNHIFVAERRTSLFITALCGRLDLPSGRLQLANAGHEPPLLIPGDGSPASFVLGSGPLLGAFERLELPPVEVTLAAGDTILFYTDGVTDARSSDGDRFDEPRLFAAVERARGGSAQDVVDEVAASIDRFAAGGEPADDITMVALGRRPAP